MKVNKIIAMVTLLFGSAALHAATLNVPSAAYPTIQACADAAKAGDTCLIAAGTYPEHVMTKAGGTDETHRLIFKAAGMVTMQGFDIAHSYVTIDGFDITGYSQRYSGHINVFPDNPNWGTPGAHYCEILNNTIRDGNADVMGILFSDTLDSLSPATHCVVRGNTLRNLNYVFLTTRGGFHLFENNRFEQLDSRDFVYLFGHDHVFRGNVFLNGNSIAGVGNHPDWVQSFGDNGEESYNMLFEQNWVQDLEAQLGQMDGGGGANGIQSNIHDYIFRNNVFVNVEMNMNIDLPGVRFEHNTFYRIAYALSGVMLSGSLTRGDISRVFLENNAFVAGGDLPDPYGGRGWYDFSGMVFSQEVMKTFMGVDDNTASAIANDMWTNGYFTNPNGILTNKARALTDISQFVMGPAVISYRPAVYPLFAQTIALDIAARNTFYADYDFVTSRAAEGYPSKQGFSELHGVNGGNPRFQIDFSSPQPFLGPDLKPFTLDDGLKPLSGSPLCGKGANGKDIGVYSCQADQVLADGSPAPDFPPVTPGVGGGHGGNPNTPGLHPNATFNNFKNIFNPTKDAPLMIQYSASGDDATLTVYDRKGNEVKALDRGSNIGTVYTTTWDGRNRSGSVVASGPYILVLKQGGVVQKKKVMVVK